jgi:hypothetical protein
MNHLFSRRDFKRAIFNEPIQSSIEIVTLSYNNDIKSNEVENIYVLNMSAGGLRFVSKVEFTVNFLTIYKINLKINDKELDLFGKIIRKGSLPNHFFDYGVKFDFNYTNNQKNLGTVEY